MSREEIREFFETQVKNWPLAAQNVKALENVLTKPFYIGDKKGFVQYNPARAISTLAKLDKESIKKRECFLCPANRPAEQKGIELEKDWELLVNPFPILPMHFTIVNKKHTAQKLDLEIVDKLTDHLHGMTVFFNGAQAGASAPDHIHYQAVPFDRLPFVIHIDKNWEKINEKQLLPFKIITDINELTVDNPSINAYFWVTEQGEKRFFAIPRVQHRPKSFFLNPPNRRAVSPGAIDMAGIIITPYQEDFNAISSEDIINIYQEVAYPND